MFGWLSCAAIVASRRNLFAIAPDLHPFLARVVVELVVLVGRPGVGPAAVASR